MFYNLSSGTISLYILIHWRLETKERRQQTCLFGRLRAVKPVTTEYTWMEKRSSDCVQTSKPLHAYRFRGRGEGGMWWKMLLRVMFIDCRRRRWRRAADENCNSYAATDFNYVTRSRVLPRWPTSGSRIIDDLADMLLQQLVCSVSWSAKY